LKSEIASAEVRMQRVAAGEVEVEAPLVREYCAKVAINHSGTEGPVVVMRAAKAAGAKGSHSSVKQKVNNWRSLE